MKNILVHSTLLCILLNSQAIAEEIEIKLVDESEKSALYQRGNIEGTIVGCSENTEKKELTCSKKPKDAILSQLPSSKQIEEVDLEDDNERNKIKEQLATILKELNNLKEAQKADRATIKELKSIISTLKNKQPMPQIKSEQETHIKQVLKERISQITPKKSRSKTVTIIRKPIKEISRTESEVIIEVQNNESLSTYAQAYYNDNTKYYRIYKANRDKIPKSLMIVIGDRLRIPLD